MTWSKTIRTLVRLLWLAAVLVALLGLLPWPAASKAVPAASPLVAVCSAVATRSFQLAFLGGAAVAAVCLVRPRWFCRWACPTGLMVDACAGAGRGIRPAGRSGRGSDLAATSAAEGADAAPAKPRINPAAWVFWGTLAGSVAGYPVLLWLDPLAMLASAAGPREAWPATLAAAGGLGLIALLSLILGKLWCARLCPLGAMQDTLSSARRLAGAAWVRRPHPQADRQATGKVTARRAALASVAGVGVAVALRRRGQGAEPVFRPPGAVAEEQFTGLCIRCGACIRACPVHILRTDLAAAGSAAGWLAPVLVFGSEYCREDCARCTEVCPSGAIEPLGLARKPQARIGLAEIDLTLCLLANGRECNSCIRTCPYGAIESVFDEGSWTSKPVLHSQKCNGCGACVPVCPAAPQAVAVKPV